MIGELRSLRKTILPPLTGEAAKKFLTEGFYHFKQKRQRGNPLTLLLSRGTVPADNFLSISARFAVLYNRPVKKKTR